jgi:hypothetical protein
MLAMTRLVDYEYRLSRRNDSRWRKARNPRGREFGFCGTTASCAAKYAERQGDFLPPANENFCAELRVGAETL